MQIKKLAFFAILLTVIFTGCEDKGTISADALVSPKSTTKDTKQNTTKDTTNTKKEASKKFALTTHDNKEIFLNQVTKVGFLNNIRVKLYC